MANILFYFSGTGNSLAIARALAGHMSDTELVSIAAPGAQRQLSSYERVGFVFPVYYACLPAIVARFVSALRLDKVPYVFGVATAGGMAGMCFAELERLVRASGGTLHASFKVSVPGNYILNYSAFPPFLQKSRLKRAKKKAAGIAAAAMRKEARKIPRGNFYARASEAQCREIMATFGESARNFTVDAGSCARCGLCAKLCPVQNISLPEGAPAWADACERCMACLQWCPEAAINFGDKTAKRTRYHHPDIEAADLIRQF